VGKHIELTIPEFEPRVLELALYLLQTDLTEHLCRSQIGFLVYHLAVMAVSLSPCSRPSCDLDQQRYSEHCTHLRDESTATDMKGYHVI
jgi:hypothetical protein